MAKSTDRQVVSTDGAPKAIGPYSQAITTGEMVFTAGQIGLVPATGELITGGIADQTRQALSNIESVLQAADSEKGLVVKTTVYLHDMNDFAAMNAVYAEFFPDRAPARSTIGVAALPKGALVEIDAVALKRAG